MANLGVPFKIAYWAKDAKSGLTSITAKVLKPDGTTVGPLILTEVIDPDFSGSYTATFNTLTNDDEGNYLFVISSPSEGNHKAFKTEYFQGKPTISGVDIGINRIAVLEAEVSVVSSVEADIIEKDVIAEALSTSRIEATFYRDELDYFLDNQNIEGEY